MAEQEKIHQGWLYTRDGEKFAPITLIDDVFAMNGKKYKDVVNGDINSLKSTLNTALSSLNTTNSTQDTQIKALQNEDKAIRQEIVDKFANLNTDDNDKLFVIDKNDNVMAYIDASGVHSLDFLVGEKGVSIAKFIEDDYKSFVTSTTGTLSDLTKKLANFGDDESDKFFIVDQYNNVIAYFDSEGTKSINFTTPEGNLNQVIADLDEEIGVREDLAKDVGANGVAIAQIKKDIQYFNATDEDTKLFVIDKNNYVIAYIDAAGVHSLDFFSSSTSLENTYNKLNKEITDRGDAIIELKKYVDTQDSGVTEAYKKAIKDEADARAQADNGLAKSLSDAKQELQGNIDKEIEARQQGDQSNAAAIATNQANISGNASQIANIKKDLENFDLTASDAMYIIDKNTNVLAKFDSVGLTVTNVVLGEVGGRNMQTNGIFYGTSEAKTYNF